jgi:hypothetical protein
VCVGGGGGAENMDRNLEDIGIDYVGLNAASHAYPLWKLPKETLDGKNCFAVENIEVITEEESVNHFVTVGAIHVSCNQPWITQPDI